MFLCVQANTKSLLWMVLTTRSLGFTIDNKLASLCEEEDKLKWTKDINMVENLKSHGANTNEGVQQMLDYKNVNTSTPWTKGIYKYLVQWNHECTNLKRRERALGRSWGGPNLIIWYKDGEGKNIFWQRVQGIIQYKTERQNGFKSSSGVTRVPWSVMDLVRFVKVQNACHMQGWILVIIEK